MKEYLLVLDKDERTALGTVRCLPNLLVAEEGVLYVRGIDEETLQNKLIKKLPVIHSYLLDDSERMFPLHTVTPVDKLPLLPWVPIKTFIKIELPVSGLPGKLTGKLPVRLMPGEYPGEGCAMITSLATWQAYAETAPAVRLEMLQFAVATDGDVLLVGKPLPPIPGKEYYEEEGILLPAGFAFEAPMVAIIVKQKLKLNEDDIILFLPSGEWHRIASSLFTQATRSAVRLTTITKEAW